MCFEDIHTIDRRRGVLNTVYSTVRLQQTALRQQISTPLLKTGPMWTNASTRWDACVFSTRSQRSASSVILSFDSCSTAIRPGGGGV